MTSNADRGVDGRRWAALVVAVLLPLTSIVGFAPPARAATMTSYVGFAYDPGSVEAPSADKPQSKLWFHDGRWWALMLTSAAAGAGTVHIFVLGSDHTWRDTGVAVDTRANATGDALPDGDRLYVVSRDSGSDIRVTRFGYDDKAGTYRAVGAPEQVSAKSAESATIAKDTRGRLWVTFTSEKTVWVTHTQPGDESQWRLPFQPLVADVTIDSDDISAIVALPGAVGVMWSDQASSAFRFAVHRDGDPDETWSMETAMTSPAIADDHINIKSLAAGDDGRVYAAVKSSLDNLPDASASDPLIYVLTRAADGSWSNAVVGTVGDGMTRPLLMLDETNRQLFVFYTVDTPNSGKIYYKTSRLGPTLSFPSGRGTAAIHYPGTNINNAAGSKDPVNSRTGLVVLASDDDSRTYYHAEMPLPAAADAVPPSKPTVTVTTSPGSAEVRWTEATDNVAVTGYRVLRDGTEVWQGTSGTSYTDAPVGAGSHTYAVAAVDGDGNTTTSDPRTVTVPARPAAGAGDPHTLLAAVTTGDGQADLASRGDRGGLLVRPWTATTRLGEITDLGGGVVGAPAISRFGERREVFVRGTDGALWWRVRPTAGAAWSGWASLGGGLRGRPAAVALPTGATLVAVRGTDGAVWLRERAATGSWSSWWRLGGGLADGTGPALAVAAPDRVELVVHGTDHGVWQRARLGSGSTARWTGWAALGGRLLGDPALATDGAGRVDAVVRGTTTAGYVRTLVHGRPTSGWASIGGRLTTSPVAVQAASGARLDVLGNGTDNRLWRATRTGGRWAGWALAQ